MEQTAKALWDTMSVASDALYETNDCTVRCLSVITGLDYDVCHAQLAKQGRKPRKGIHWMIEGPKACKALGFDLIRLRYDDYRAKTMITAERDRKLQSGKFAVLVRGHVAGMDNGNVVDWSQGRRHKIQAVYQCSPIPGFAPMAAADLPKGSDRWTAFTKYTKRDNLELF